MNVEQWRKMLLTLVALRSRMVPANIRWYRWNPFADILTLDDPVGSPEVGWAWYGETEYLQLRDQKGCLAAFKEQEQKTGSQSEVNS